jgi:hypothetical protein
MSFSTIVDGVIRTITQHADYSCATVYYEDYRPLGAGQLRYVAVSNAGYAREELTFSNIAHNWTVAIDLYSMYTGQIPTTRKNALTNMQTIIDTLEQYPRLSDTTGVINYEISSITPLENMQPTAGRNAHVKQQIVLTVQEIVRPTMLE